MAKDRPRMSLQARYQVQGKKRNRVGRLIKWLEIVAVLVVLTGVCVALYQWHSNRVENNRAAKLVYEANHDINHSVPSTNKPSSSEFDNYTVPASSPRYIFINKLGIRAIVRPLGVTTEGSLAAPDNIYDVGWFTGSSKPGKPGAMVMDGHVSSWTAKGVFHDILSLKPGDTVQIERGDGSILSYRVVKSITYGSTQIDMSKVLSTVTKGKAGLNLITCTGEVIKGTNEFNKRVVVYTEQM